MRQRIYRSGGRKPIPTGRMRNLTSAIRVDRADVRHVVLDRAHGVGQDDGRDARSRPASAARSSTTTSCCERRTGRTAREIAAAEGADALHRREAEALVDALATPEPAVVGGRGRGACSSPARPRALRRPRRRVPARRARRARRAARGDGRRRAPPVRRRATPPAVLDEQFAARDARYRALATLVVDADATARRRDRRRDQLRRLHDERLERGARRRSRAPRRRGSRCGSRRARAGSASRRAPRCRPRPRARAGSRARACGRRRRCTPR